LVGIKAANALSDYLVVTSCRDNKIARMRFEKGIRKDFKVEKSPPNAKRGTTIEFLPDSTIFKEDGIEIPKERIVKQLQEFSFLCSNLELNLTYKDDKTISFKSVDGITDYVSALAPSEERITQIFRTSAQEGSYSVDIALTYTTKHTETIKIYTNNIPNTAGTHLTGYRSAMTRAINDVARATGILKEKDENLSGEDLKEGLVLVLSLTMRDPVFSGQTKEVLTSAEGRTVVERLLGPEIRRWFQSNPKDLKAIVNKALLSKKARLAAKRAREATRSKSKTVLTSTLQGKLADCLTKDPELAEIYLVEGE
jgi:DNA gyrase subunit B